MIFPREAYERMQNYSTIEGSKRSGRMLITPVPMLAGPLLF
jgi:hypothetical protein